MQELLDKIANTSDCRVFPPQGIPQIGASHKLPEDLSEFYKLCGGVNLYESSWFGIRIYPPSEFTSANPAIRGVGITKEQLSKMFPKSHISWNWYIVAEGTNAGEYLIIDLGPRNLGRCYEGFWNSYAHPKFSPIVATSFTDLLIRMLDNKGEYWYWDEDDFESFGSAYDK